MERNRTVFLNRVEESPPKAGASSSVHSSQYHLSARSVKSATVSAERPKEEKEGGIRTLRLLRHPDTREVEPLPDAAFVVARDHLSIRVVVAVAISRLSVLVLRFEVLRFGSIRSSSISPLGQLFKIGISLFNVSEIMIPDLFIVSAAPLKCII